MTQNEAREIAEHEARMLIKHMRQAPDDWDRSERLARRWVSIMLQRHAVDR